MRIFSDNIRIVPLAGSGTRNAVISSSGDIQADTSTGTVAYEPLFTGRRTVALTNGVETTLIPTKTFPAGFWAPGKCVRGKIQMFVYHAATVLVKIEGNLFATFTLPDAFRGELEFALTCESIGDEARFAFFGSILYAQGSSGTDHGSPWFGDSAPNPSPWYTDWSIDTDAANDLEISIGPSYTEDCYLTHGSITTYSP